MLVRWQQEPRTRRDGVDYSANSSSDDRDSQPKAFQSRNTESLSARQKATEVKRPNYLHKTRYVVTLVDEPDRSDQRVIRNGRISRADNYDFDGKTHAIEVDGSV